MKIKHLFSNSIIQNTVYICFFIFVGIISYSQAFFFHFFMDDWGLLWYAVTDLDHYFSIFTYHPGLFISFYPWVFWFGDNPIYYNLVGFMLKVLAALSFGLIFKQLFSSLKFFWLGSILYVSFFGGLEAFTFTGARITALVIIATNLIIYFYFRSVYLKNKYNFVSMLMVLYLAILADPLKIIFLPYLLLFWESIEQLVNNQIQVKNLVLRFLVISGIVLAGFLSTGFGLSLFNPSTDFQKGIIYAVLSHPEYVTNFSNSLVFLIGVYFDGPSGFDKILGRLFISPSYVMFFLIISTVFTLAWVYIKKRQHFSYLFLSILAIPILYIPNWVAFPYLNTYAAHRYQALSAVFLLFLISFVIFCMKGKKLYIALVLILLLNMVRSYQILQVEKNYRDYSKIESIYQYMNQIIPSSEKAGIIYYHGEGNILANQVTWAGGGSIPIALIRHTYQLSETFSATSDLDLAARLMCSSNQSTRLAIDRWIPREGKIDPKFFHSFHIDVKGNIEDDTQKILPQALEKCQELN